MVETSVQTQTTAKEMANADQMFSKALQQLNMLQKVIAKRVNKDFQGNSESKRIKQHFRKQYLEKIINRRIEEQSLSTKIQTFGQAPNPLDFNQLQQTQLPNFFQTDQSRQSTPDFQPKNMCLLAQIDQNCPEEDKFPKTNDN